MAADYWIDESDPPYPQIRHRSHPDTNTGYVKEEFFTLRQAKEEIKKTCRSHRQHWLAVMHHQLEQTPEKLMAEAERARNDA